MPACEKFETMSKFASSGVMGWCFINTLIMTGACGMGQGHRTGKSITTPGLFTSQPLFLLNYVRPDGMVRYLQTLVLLGSRVLVQIGGTYSHTIKIWGARPRVRGLAQMLACSNSVLQSDEMYSVLSTNTLVNPSSAYNK